MKEKKLSVYGLICGCRRKIWVFLRCLRIIPSILKVGGPEYHGSEKIKLWFDEWNTRGTVLQWDIKQFFHKANQTMVEWYFKNQMNDGKVEAFDGISLVEWTNDDKILFLKEFGCNINNYDPYQNGSVPQFKGETSPWF